MIITSPIKLDVNETYDKYNLGMSFEIDGELRYDYRFLVIREASELEFIKYLEDTYGNSEPFDLCGNYYQISMD